jgi:hypothetical protein
MKHMLLSLVLLLGAVAPASSQTMFGAELQAQQHCPKDTIVWLNIPTSIYHMPGMRWYGATKHGAYVCQKEAGKAGDRETRNGQ